MKKFNKILIILAAILLIAFVAVIYRQKFGFEKPYYAVYMSDGNIYFGKISNFPKFALTDVWILQGSGNSSELTVSKFNEAVLGPDNKMFINSDNMIWKTKLRDDSQLLARFKGQ